MTTHQYSSFEEIDKSLKILKLERDIDKESFKFDLLKFRKNIYPAVFSGGIGGLLQILIISIVSKKLSKLVKKRSK